MINTQTVPTLSGAGSNDKEPIATNPSDDSHHHGANKIFVTNATENDDEIKQCGQQLDEKHQQQQQEQQQQPSSSPSSSPSQQQSVEQQDINSDSESNINNNSIKMCSSESSNSLNYGKNGSIDKKDSPTEHSSDASSTLLQHHQPSTTRHLSPATSSLSPILLSPCRSLDGTSDDEYDEIGRLFETKSKLIEKWLREKAPQEVIHRIHQVSEQAATQVRTPRSPKRTSVTSDLFQQWLASSPVQVSFELFVLFSFAQFSYVRAQQCQSVFRENCLVPMHPFTAAMHCLSFELA